MVFSLPVCVVLCLSSDPSPRVLDWKSSRCGLGSARLRVSVGAGEELIPPFTGQNEVIEVLHIPQFSELFWCHCGSEGRLYIHELSF